MRVSLFSWGGRWTKGLQENVRRESGVASTYDRVPAAAKRDRGDTGCTPLTGGAATPVTGPGPPPRSAPRHVRAAPALLRPPVRPHSVAWPRGMSDGDGAIIKMATAPDASRQRGNHPPIRSPTSSAPPHPGRLRDFRRPGRVGNFSARCRRAGSRQQAGSRHRRRAGGRAACRSRWKCGGGPIASRRPSE